MHTLKVIPSSLDFTNDGKALRSEDSSLLYCYKGNVIYSIISYFNVIVFFLQTSFSFHQQIIKREPLCLMWCGTVCFKQWIFFSPILHSEDIYWGSDSS